jgi:hypothetical protein
MHDLKQYLDTIDPRLWWLSIALAVYALVFVWRRLSAALPASVRFDQIPARLKVLPAVVLAAVVGAAGLDSAEIGKNLLDLLLAAVAGVTAIGGHETLSRLAGAAAPPNNQE